MNKDLKKIIDLLNLEQFNKNTSSVKTEAVLGRRITDNFLNLHPTGGSREIGDDITM